LTTLSNYRVFVDGQEGTTGLEINERLQRRDDVEVLRIDPAKRKDLAERARLSNQADIVFLCLPDDAAREAVEVYSIENRATRIIDASTAHRVADGWAYGIPELSAAHRERIACARLVSNPGCFATGFNMLMYPLVSSGLVPAAYPASCHAVTGYSGGGRKLIERYEAEENRDKLASPCFYALGLQHKHLPEMQKHSGLLAPPIFTPIVGNYYRGMTVAVPLLADVLKTSAEEIQAFYSRYYQGQRFVKVMPLGAEEQLEWGYLDAEGCNHTNNIELYVFGDSTRVLLAARLDNLGKGASGAAVQNMNIMLGLDEGEGL